jgi:hypothetical protein
LGLSECSTGFADNSHRSTSSPISRPQPPLCLLLPCAFHPLAPVASLHGAISPIFAPIVSCCLLPVQLLPLPHLKLHPKPTSLPNAAQS